MPGPSKITNDNKNKCFFGRSNARSNFGRKKTQKSGKRMTKGVYPWTKVVIPELTNGTHAVTGGRVREGKTLPGVIRCGQGSQRRWPQGRRIENAGARPPHLQ